MTDYEKKQIEYYKNKAERFEQQNNFNESASGCAALILGIIGIILIGILA